MRRTARQKWVFMAICAFLLAIASQGVADDFDFGDEDFDFGDEDFDFDDEDDFDFGDEDFELDDDDDFVFDDEGFEFDEDEFADEVEEPSEARTTALFVPGGPVSGADADELTDSLMSALEEIEQLIVVPNRELAEEFEIMGTDLALECAFDAVCLGRYGRELGYDHVIVGRVVESADGRWTTTLNRFETQASSITNYRTFTTDAGLQHVDQMMGVQAGLLYGIRPERASIAPPSRAWQRGVAWGSLGASAATLGVGIAFALKASSIESDLRDTPVEETADGERVLNRTQREAQTEIDRGRNATSIANAMFITSAGLAVVSGVFFLVQAGGDIDLDADIAQLRTGPRFTPVAGRDGFGVSGQLSF